MPTTGGTVTLSGVHFPPSPEVQLRPTPIVATPALVLTATSDMT